MTNSAGKALIVAARVVATVGGAAQVHKIATVIRTQSGFTLLARSMVLSASSSSALRPAITELVDAWAADCDVSGATLSGMLIGAGAVADHLRTTQSTEIVWTGPSTSEVPVRMSREVLLQVIASASSKLTVVSFAAYKVPELSEALLVAVGRGVSVRLVLETVESGKLTFDSTTAFKELRGKAAFLSWPTAERGGDRSTMHAKAAIADDHTALVTSANLTGAAIDTNIELGLLLRGGPVPAALQRHFDLLIEQGVLEE